jgi:uracil-DNA glycosylase
LLVGSYAIYYYLPHSRRRSMTDTVAGWRDFLPAYFVLPHPSWRTIGWLRRNPWFETAALPDLRTRIRRVVDSEALGRQPLDAIVSTAFMIRST